MDVIDNAKPLIHYESVIEARTDVQNEGCAGLWPMNDGKRFVFKALARREQAQQKDLINALVVKHLAFECMDRLHGWCSKEKAAILIDMILKYKPKIIVEIGVFGGKSLVPMAFALNSLKKGTIYGIDPWCAEESIQGMDPASFEWWGQVDHELILDSLLKEIYAAKLEKQVVLIRATSAECPGIQQIDLLHIDGNHSEKASFDDVTKWVPLVREGGLIVFDDVTWSTTNTAVEWLNKHCTKIAAYRGENEWAVWIKRRPKHSRSH